MYSPCVECFNKYGKSYTKECDNNCEYAHAISKLKPYGGLDAVIKVMNGDAFPLVLMIIFDLDTFTTKEDAEKALELRNKQKLIENYHKYIIR